MSAIAMDISTLRYAYGICRKLGRGRIYSAKTAWHFVFGKPGGKS